MIALEIAMIAIGMSLISIWAKYSLTDQKAMKEKQEKIKAFQKRYMEAMKKGDKEALKALEDEEREVKKLAHELMKDSFKPMIFTFVPIIIVLGIMNVVYGKYGVVITIPLLNIGLNWIWWYIIVALISSLIINKIVWRVKYGAKEKK